jgi:hypothetical protein
VKTLARHALVFGIVAFVVVPLSLPGIAYLIAIQPRGGSKWA